MFLYFIIGGEICVDLQINRTEMPFFEKTEDEKIPSSPYGALIDEMIAGAPSLRDAIDAVLNRDNTPFKKNELKEAAIKIKEIFSE